MKIYYVSMSFFDGGHDHGYYQSPMFAKKEDAERFKEALIAEKSGKKRWWSDGGWNNFGPEDSVINEMNVLDEFDGQLADADNYLTISYA